MNNLPVEPYNSSYHYQHIPYYQNFYNLTTDWRDFEQYAYKGQDFYYSDFQRNQAQDYYYTDFEPSEQLNPYYTDFQYTPRNASNFQSAGSRKRKRHYSEEDKQPECKARKYYEGDGRQRVNLDLNILYDTIGATDLFVNYHRIYEDEEEYRMIQDLITDHQIVIDRIERVENPMLQAAYELKKAEKMAAESEDENLREILLFHGTKSDYVSDICFYNFNWRRCVNHKFGYGVSFSKNASVSSHYCDHGPNKVMLVAKVLVGKSCFGSKDMILPDAGCDHSKKAKKGSSVIVKYDDAEFMPAYKIDYHLKVGSRMRLPPLTYKDKRPAARRRFNPYNFYY